jgi:hypothetical protein
MIFINPKAREFAPFPKYLDKNPKKSDDRISEGDLSF